MAFLHDDERDAGLVANLELHARLTDGAKLLCEHLFKNMIIYYIVRFESTEHLSCSATHTCELALTDAVAVEDDARGLEARAAVEMDEKLLDH